VDYYGPSKILLRQENAFGMTCKRARDLIVQEYDNQGNLWATRGFVVYRLRKGDDAFRKITRIPSDFSIFWLNSFTVIRRLTLRSECVELLIGENGDFCAFASGKMWNSFDPRHKFHKTLELPQFGIGIGRGVMSTGILQVNGLQYYYGEYFV